MEILMLKFRIQNKDSAYHILPLPKPEWGLIDFCKKKINEYL